MRTPRLLVALVATTGAVVGSLIVSAGLDGLVSHAERYGQPWDVFVTSIHEAELDDAWGSPRTIPPAVGLTPDLRAAALTPMPTASTTPAAPSVAPYLGEPVW